MRISRTRSDSKPASAVASFLKVPSISPAPASSTMDKATCNNTSALPRLKRECPPTTPRAFVLMAACGSTRVPRSAGAIPNNNPVNSATTMVKERTRASTVRSRNARVPNDGKNPNRTPHPHFANSAPNAAPANERRRLSVRNWRIKRARSAPRAMRIAISRCRDAARARSRFATLAQAIKSTNPTTPISTSSA